MSGSNTRYQLSSFSMFDYKSIEDNLTVMAQKGWRIERIGAFLWKFKRAEPSKKKFAVVFPRASSEFESMPAESQTLLDELCMEGGWEKEIEWKQMQIYCADPEAIPMETDEAVRLENVHLNMKKTFILGWILTLFSMLVLAFSNGMKYFGNSPYSDEGTLWAFLATLYVALTAVVSLSGYLYWLKASRRRISEGGTCVSATWHRRLLNGLLIGFLVILISYFADTKIHLGEGLVFYIIVYMVSALAVISFSNSFSQYLKGKGWSSRSNIMLSTIVATTLFISMIVITKIIEVIISK